MSAKTPRRILWIHPGGLLPISGGGAARTWALIDYLRAKGYTVDLLTGDQGDVNAPLEARVDRLWVKPDNKAHGRKARLLDRARVVYRRLDPKLRWLHRIPFPGRPIAVPQLDILERNRRKDLEAFAGQVAYANPPLAAIASYAWMAPALDHMPPGTLRILDTIDVQHLRRDTAAKAGGDLDHVRCTKEDEIRELGRADMLLAIQEEEGVVLAAMCPDKAICVTPHALVVPPYVPSPAASKNLLYVGNLYDPNILGLRRIVESIWPRVRKEVPDATLTVCGRVGESLRRRHRGIKTVGQVPDLAPYYQQAAVVLNPVPYGTGLKIKTVEALAHGRCVVCSEAGTGGLGTPDTLPLVACDTDEGMCFAIVALLRDVEARHGLEARAWTYTQTHFSPDVVYGPLTDLLDSSDT